MEEPAQGVGAHAPPSQAHGMKQEPPGVANESQKSPQAVKRPLEPAIGLENGDAKRLKLAESAPEKEQTPMETPAPKLVQPDSESSYHEPMQITHDDPKPEPALEPALEQGQKTAAEGREVPVEEPKPESIHPPLPLTDTNLYQPPTQVEGSKPESTQPPLQLPDTDLIHPPVQLPDTNLTHFPTQAEGLKPESIHPSLPPPDTHSIRAPIQQAAPKTVQAPPRALVPELTSGPEPENPPERKSSLSQIAGSAPGPTPTSPPAARPTQESEQSATREPTQHPIPAPAPQAAPQSAAHEPAQHQISAPAPQLAPHEPVPEPVADQGHEDPPMDMDLDLDAMVQDVLGDINNQMSSFQSIESPLQPDTNAANNLADHPLSEPAEPPVTFLSNPTKATQIAALPSLVNLGVHILLILSQRPVHELHDAIRTPGSETAEIWASIKSLFTQTRSLFSQGSPILRQESLALQGATEELRIANLASLCCSLTSTGRDADSADRLELYSDFFPTVLRHNAELSRRVADLFVATKTQAIIDSVARGVQEKPIDQIIDEAFPAHLEQILTQRHEGSDLTDTERFLVRSAQERKDALLSHIAEGQDENRLRLMYNDLEVFQLLSSYLHRELASYGQLACKYDIEWPQREASETPMPDPAEDSEMDEQALESLLEATDGLVAQYLPNGGIEALTEPAMPSTEGGAPPVDSQPNGIEDGAETSTPAPNGVGDSHISDTHDLFAEIEHQTQEYVRTTLSNLSPTPYQPTVPQPTGGTVSHQTPYLSHLQQHTQNNHPPPSHYFGYPPLDATRRGDGEEPGPLPPTQSLPSAVLYDRARQAALSKNTNPQRREGGSSTRRPWTQDEEKALMMGLDKVQGPHWSQILSLYGPGGSISNILKDRSQVQLKDKARNLKLFFLKSNSEMPYYLQAVTGELKTRAPGQAARKEAEEKARQKSEEIQVRPASALAMASGLQSSPQSQPQASPVNAHPFHDLNHLAQASAAPAAPTAQKSILAPNHTQPATSAAARPPPSAMSPVRSEAQPQSTTSYNIPAATATASQGPATPTMAAPYTPTYTPPVSQPQSQPHTQPQTPASYTPTQSFTPTQPPPIASPQVKAEESLAELAQHMAAEEAAAAAAAAAVSAAGSVHETSVANTELPDASHPPLLQDPFDDHDDLKDAALMQSLRELEAYSGTSVS